MREINDLLWMKLLIIVQTKQKILLYKNRHLNQQKYKFRKNAQI